MSVSPIAPPSLPTLDSDEVIAQAAEFFAFPEVQAVTDQGRFPEVRAEILRTGSYQHSATELLVGAKLAWRNHARCAGRYSWRNLRLLDMRDRRTPDEIAEGCFEHLRVSTNEGKLRSVITVFDQARPGRPGPRVHNPQLIRYAGYRAAEGTTGDPLHIELTERVQALGWAGSGGHFDVLPLLVSVDDSPPSMYDVPAGAVLEVPIEHPELSWFAELGLRWHANPAISNLCLEIGGIQYPAAPFSGWYVSSEIGARNLSDGDRYDMLPEIARRMGLSTKRNASLWKDRALIELNRAVLWSYDKAGVYIVDHHTAAAQFVTHVDREAKCGREVPADWAWVNPPLSASTTPTYHRSFDRPDFSLRPNFYQLDKLPGVAAGAGEQAEPAIEPAAAVVAVAAEAEPDLAPSDEDALTAEICPWPGNASAAAV
ncbi:MAG: nitric oxide synthase oxygenase [Jatrophihabitans sp.]